jgi:endo-1,4-beta-xylanase
LLKTHIQTIVGRYKNDILSWDVVNEAFLEDGSLRNSLWLQKLGPAYIEKAFRYAREVAPDALLFYNDYNLESNPAKLNSVLKLLNALRNRGVRVDGIGVQMHVSIAYPEPAQIAKAFQQISTEQYRVHVSELDVSVNPFGRDLEPNAKIWQQQADLLGAIVLHYRQIPQQLQFGITLWGVSDQNSWIRYFYQRADYPLLYDDQYQPKPAYCKMKELL